MGIFILLLALALLIGFVLWVILFKFMIGWFKPPVPSTFRHSINISIFTLLISVAVQGIAYVLIKNEFVVQFLGTLACAIVFVFLLRKLYQLKSTGKIIGIIAASIVLEILLTLVVVIPMRVFVMQPFTVEGETMEPTYAAGTYLVIKQFGVHIERGDVVVFRYPNDPRQYFIKRAISIPGDLVEITDNAVYINGHKLEEDYLLPETPTPGNGTWELQEGEYFMLGDNRERSLDSRVFGPVSKELIIGEVWFEPFSDN